ncbi:hypothetical protein [Effusibacillus pohliae]|uniref:hypothetical protein n=1 Tax=Effusibacillus pohliae TaxID=232270 RepID=UPI000361295D|nr:hypothetical protein [Effusibacillus pohliae]
MDPRKTNAKSNGALQPVPAVGKRSLGASSRKKSAARKSNPAAKSQSPGSSGLPSNLFSISNLNNLSALCKQCIKYLQQADLWLETMYKATNTLNETGILKKIMQSKGKDLSTGDLAGLLMAFMNTPLADQFFKGGSSGNSAPQESPPKQTAEPHVQPTLPAPQNQPPGYPAQPQSQYPQYAPGPAQPPHVPAWPGYMQGYGPPQYPPQLPGYGYPPGAQPPRPNA